MHRENNQSQRKPEEVPGEWSDFICGTMENISTIRVGEGCFAAGKDF